MNVLKIMQVLNITISLQIASILSGTRQQFYLEIHFPQFIAMLR